MRRALFVVGASLLVGAGALVACVGDLPPVADQDGGPGGTDGSIDAPRPLDAGGSDALDAMQSDAPIDGAAPDAPIDGAAPDAPIDGAAPDAPTDAPTNDAGDSATDARSDLDTGLSDVWSPDAGCVGVPCTVKGLVAWYRADRGVDLNGAVVTRWHDLSGHGYDLVPAADAIDAGATGATVHAAGINSHTAIYFEEVSNVAGDGPDALKMESPFPQALAQPYEEIGVFEPSRTGVEVWFLSDGLTHSPGIKSATLGYSYYPNCPAGGYCPSAFLGAGGALYSDDPNFNPFVNNGLLNGVWSGLFNGSSSQLWINGVSRAQGQGGGNALDGLTLGRFPGYIGEFLLYSAALSDKDRQALEVYLKNSWSF
jgi:hypothetical protein